MNQVIKTNSVWVGPTTDFFIRQGRPDLQCRTQRNLLSSLSTAHPPSLSLQQISYSFVQPHSTPLAEVYLTKSKEAEVPGKEFVTCRERSSHNVLLPLPPSGPLRCKDLLNPALSVMHAHCVLLHADAQAFSFSFPSPPIAPLFLGERLEIDPPFANHRLPPSN